MKEKTKKEIRYDIIEIAMAKVENVAIRIRNIGAQSHTAWLFGSEFKRTQANYGFEGCNDIIVDNCTINDKQYRHYAQVLALTEITRLKIIDAKYEVIESKVPNYDHEANLVDSLKGIVLSGRVSIGINIPRESYICLELKVKQIK